MHVRLLRWFVAAALLANIAFAAWHAGALSFLGLRPASERDPTRLEQQVRPGAVRVLHGSAAAAAVAAATPTAPAAPTSAASAAAPAASEPPSGAASVAQAASAVARAASAPPAAPAAPAATPTAALSGTAGTCLEVGPLDGTTAVEGVERALAAVLPARPWVREARPGGPQFAVFVGPIMSRDAARQRREELQKLKIGFEAIELPGGREGGYSLGRHDSSQAAGNALEALRARGLRGGSVVQVRENGMPRTWLRLDKLDDAGAAAVRGLSAAALGGQSASACSAGSVAAATAPR